MDCSPPGSSVHGILQARILEWVLPSPGDLPSPGIKLQFLALQADLDFSLELKTCPFYGWFSEEKLRHTEREAFLPLLRSWVQMDLGDWVPEILRKILKVPISWCREGFRDPVRKCSSMGLLLQNVVTSTFSTVCSTQGHSCPEPLDNPFSWSPVRPSSGPFSV